MRHGLRGWGVALLATVSGLSIESRRASPAGPPSPEATARELYRAIDSGGLGQVSNLLSDSAAVHLLGVPQPMSKGAILDAIKVFYQAFPNNTHVIEQAVAGGDRVAVQITQHATSKAPYEGAPVTGKPVIVPAIHILRVAGGRVTEWWILEDNLGLMQQLGMELNPGRPAR